MNIQFHESDVMKNSKFTIQISLQYSLKMYGSLVDEN